MNVALTRHYEDLIDGLISSGRYNNASEVVRAGLRALESNERAEGKLVFPPGSLRKLYTPSENRKERLTARASTLKVEAE
jgi:Arc/MetJ-type ribon-helix-helix transcriptional regulator